MAGVPYSLLRAKLAIRHQVNLVGEVHVHGKFNQQVDAETIAALRHNGLSCGVGSRQLTINYSVCTYLKCVESSLAYFTCVL